MFLSVVTHPHYDHHQHDFFDGKLGIWPFIKIEPAKISSQNRPRGALVMKPIDSITTMEYQEFILEKVLPAIEEK
jgi:hypothetical protein